MTTKTGYSLYYKYILIREVEKKIIEIFPSDKIQSPVHLSLGCEIPSILVSELTNNLDKIFPSYRGHAAYLAHGGNLKRFWAELYGRKTGAANGYGGSMHMIDLQNGIQGTSAVVASHIPIACGTAYTMKNSENLVIVYFGDGATETGSFFESINLSDLYDLPMVFICENNKKADSSPLKSRRKQDILRNYINPFCNLRTQVIKKEEDIKTKLRLTELWVSYTGRYRKPCFIEYEVEREIDHVGIDGFIDNEIPYFQFGIEKNEANDIRKEVLKKVEESIEFAEKSPYPTELLGWENAF